MAKQYLATRPDPTLLEFLKHDFAGLNARYGRVTGTAFRTFPSFPQRYIEVLDRAAHRRAGCAGRADARPSVRTRYTDDDLDVREFLPARVAPPSQRYVARSLSERVQCRR